MKSVKMMLVLLGALLTLAVLYYLLKGSLESFTGGGVVVSYYFLPSCQWCEKFMPEWRKFEAQAKTQGGITTETINAAEQRKKAEEKNIQGFPTVLVKKNGTESEYSGERTAAALLAFVKE